MEISSRGTVDYLNRFSFGDLRSFTNDFDTKIGSGGFGVVYKGKFPNGMQIAVKVLNEQYVGEDQFMDEVQIMGIPLYHHNLVKFLGYCFDTNKKGLVYEYMENGSLNHILRKKGRYMEWEKLYDIMIETANGISYLHEKRIIHHDVKPANILLDSDFSPKVADFGLAKLINRDATHVTVSQTKGTPGYVAPEMIVEPFSHVTHKCDVYSFGMMLFDVLGRCEYKRTEKSFVEIVWEGFRKGQLDKIIDDCGIEEKHREKATILSMVALWCVQYTPKTRPQMNEVVKMLKREVQIMTPPNPLMPSQDSTTQLSREGAEDEVSDKEIVDKFSTQPDNEDVIAIEQQSVAPVTTTTAESSDNLAKYDFKSKTERDEIIVNYVMQYHGFSNCIPVAAVLMYNWFKQLYGEGLFHKIVAFPIVSEQIQLNLNAKVDRLVRSIDSAIEQQWDHVPYWLSITSTLIFLLQCTFKGGISGAMITLLGSIVPKSVSNLVLKGHRVHDIQSPLVFKANLVDCLEKACRITGDKLTEDLRFSLSHCIRAPTTASWRADWKASVAFSANNSHWKSIISTLSGMLKKFQDNHVPPVLTGKVFSRAFHFINAQLLNSLLTNSECCTLSYGEYLKVGLYELESWCDIAKKYVGSSWDQLKHTRQAVEFLVTINKSEISINDITEFLCPGLNIPQLYRICSVYWDDEDYTHGVSSDVLDKIRILWGDDWKNRVSSPFLLKDSSDFQYFTDDIFSSLEMMEFLYVTLEDADIVNHPKYHFLKL